jgi:hypothetical protein
MSMLDSNVTVAAQHTAERNVEPRPFEANLEITVVFTKPRATLRAMRRAGRLAAGLGAELRIIVPRIVPGTGQWQFHAGNGFRLPHLRTIVGVEKIGTRIDVRHCRDRWQMLQQELSPQSIVVMGGSSRWWWPTRESRLAQKLRAAGHTVLFCQN